MGDFNSILCHEERKGGTAILDNEIRDFTECIYECEQEEMSKHIRISLLDK